MIDASSGTRVDPKLSVTSLRCRNVWLLLILSLELSVIESKDVLFTAGNPLTGHPNLLIVPLNDTGDTLLLLIAVESHMEYPTALFPPLVPLAELLALEEDCLC